MKRLTAVLTAVLMMILSVSANAETAAADLWAQLSGQMFLFCSGAGAWDTDLIIEEDGTFTGSYHDSEMGETGEGYPNGTIYGCLFHGQLSDPEPVDEYTWTAKIAVKQDEGQVPESIEDGIRFVTAAPYGLENAQAVAIFLPGKPVDSLPEGSSLEIIPGGSHMVFVEKPFYHDFQKRLLEFLSDEAGAMDKAA